MKAKTENGSMSSSIFYYIVYAFWYAISLLPLGALYLLSDGLYYLVYHLARYRRPLVRKNLTNSFPEKSEEEIVRIEKDFYSWFCDYLVESIKLLSMSRKQMERRMVFKGVERIQHYFNEGLSCSVYLGHYCNWEWITSLPLHLTNGISAQIYHPIENAATNRLFLKLRGRFNAKSIAMDDTFRTIMTWKKEGKVNVVGYIADQVPGLQNVHCFVNFLHHDTPVFTGTERISVLIGAKVFYADITRPRRGYYVCEFKEITLPKEEYVKFAYTKKYFELLEATINRTPQYWLWSHNRWKRTREQFNQEFSEEKRKRMLNRL